jgi:hypothetical protein
LAATAASISAPVFTGIEPRLMTLFLKSIPPVSSPTIGIIIPSVNVFTIAPKAAPKMTAMARSSTLPRAMNVLKSFNIVRFS